MTPDAFPSRPPPSGSDKSGAGLFMSAEGFLDAIERELQDGINRPTGVVSQTKTGCATPSRCSWLYSTCICVDPL